MSYLDDKEHPICGVDLEPTEPGRYTCEEPASSRFPHHTACGLHHDPAKISCDMAGEMMAIDQEMMRYAR